MAKTKSQSSPQNTEALTRGKRNTVEGVVVSDKMQKTITVQVISLVRHAKYGKFIRQSAVFKAHDEKNDAKVGDKVQIFESRPYSKTKRWVLGQVLERRKQVEGIEI